MTFDDLGAAWRDLPTPNGSTLRADVAAVRTRSTVIARAVRRRDLLETAVAIALSPIFAWVAVIADSILSRVGAAVIAVACVVIPLRFAAARTQPLVPDLPLLESLRSELAMLRAQERLLTTVIWWYFAPLGIGVILLMAGAPVPIWARLSYAAVVVVLFAMLVALNAAAVRGELAPARTDLERCISSLSAPLTPEDSR